MSKIEVSQRDRSILAHICEYCEDAMDIAKQIESETAFRASKRDQLALGMCILQIGELIKHLSDDFVQNHQAMPWRMMRRMRDLYAHHYEKADITLFWNTVTQDIPALYAYCLQCLEQNNI